MSSLFGITSYNKKMPGVIIYTIRFGCPCLGLRSVPGFGVRNFKLHKSKQGVVDKSAMRIYTVTIKYERSSIL